MGINCPTLVQIYSFLCYESDSLMSLSDDQPADAIKNSSATRHIRTYILW